MAKKKQGAGKKAATTKEREKKLGEKKQIEAYTHGDKRRVNNPPVGLVTPQSDPPDPPKKGYQYDPHLDPQLVWAGKAEHTSFEVSTVSLHVHERIDPKTIIAAVRSNGGSGQGPGARGQKGSAARQMSLFEEPREILPLRDALDFYKHPHGWTNRLVAGDSLLVMNSLLEKEGMAGKVQMIYIDPPYGIRYGSNFQPFTNRRDVKDGKDEDLTQEPEMVKAFRDTWELGLHSYLTHLRDRLLLSRDLLHESGSVFMQISDENVHHVRELMHEVFGGANAMPQIVFRKTTGAGSPSGYVDALPQTFDYLLWYAKDRKNCKIRRLYLPRTVTDDDNLRWVEEHNGSHRRMTFEEAQFPERIDPRCKVFRPNPLTSQTGGETTIFDFPFDGTTYRPKKGGWKTNRDGMKKLEYSRRLIGVGNTLCFIRYLNDFPHRPIIDIWDDTRTSGFSDPKSYVVQTNAKVIARCQLMVTDPGDLVLDPTCGSGTTAYVAEQWGRRWITCDTSRVAVTLAKQRLMTAVFDYYTLAHEDGTPQRASELGTPQRASELGTPQRASELGTPQRASELGTPQRASELGTPQRASELGTPQRAFPTGVAGGFKYKTVPHVTLKSIANNPEIKEGMTREQIDAAIARHAEQETLYDQPEIDRTKARVTGPFTVEAVPAINVRPIETVTESHPLQVDLQGNLAGLDDIEPQRTLTADTSVARYGETSRQTEWRDELARTGVRAKGGQKITFARLEPMPGCRWLHAIGETKNGGQKSEVGGPKTVVVSFGPEHAPLDQRQVTQALDDAEHLRPKPQLVLFAAFHFDPEAAKDIDETKWPGVDLLKLQMNTDLLTDDLKKKRASNESFWLVGQPDVELRRLDAKSMRRHPHPATHALGVGTPLPEGEGEWWQVEVRGFDYYSPANGQIESGDTSKIAMWLLDTDYDGRSLLPRQVFFPMSGAKDGWARLAKNLKAEIDEELIEAYRGVVSLPFEAGKFKRAAVKIVDDRGIESLKILAVE